jgi:hypothetical protein
MLLGEIGGLEKTQCNGDPPNPGVKSSAELQNHLGGLQLLKNSTFGH